jgi:TonB family protein
MIQYIVQVVAFQVLFLLVYDLFLKKETFFNWNRVYLLLTAALSFVIPFIKIEQFKTVMPQEFVLVVPEILLPEVTVQAAAADTNFSMPWYWVVFIIGVAISFVLLCNKLYKLYKLKSQSSVERLPLFTKVVVKNSSIAFSFFKNIFLGDAVTQREHQRIIAHELVHIRQKHTYDLLFFECLRIAFWFNPMVYIYQKRITELHEFIADAQVTKEHKKEHYQQLLSEVFQTQNISFVNQFFKQSLLKKRIIMLTKQKSKQVFKLKYLLLVPIICSFLIYTSCEKDVVTEEPLTVNSQASDDGKTITLKINDIKSTTETERREIGKFMAEILMSDEVRTFIIESGDDKTIFKGNKNQISTTRIIDGKVSETKVREFNASKQGSSEDISFNVIEEPPVFPGCEDAANPKECFQKKIQQHISKHFRYPEEAQQAGIEGRVSVMFTIDTEGNITNVKMRGPHKILESEVARIISKLPKMKPGKQRGRTVNVPFSIPVNFKLQ